MQSNSDVHRLAEIYEGIAVLGAIPGSPASAAGTRYGDVIVEVNGQRVRTLDDYLQASESRQDTFEILVMRDGKELRLALDLRKSVDPREALAYVAKSRAFSPTAQPSDDKQPD